jgi:hypothetical protein
MDRGMVHKCSNQFGLLTLAEPTCTGTSVRVLFVLVAGILGSLHARATVMYVNVRRRVKSNARGILINKKRRHDMSFTRHMTNLTI